MVEDVEIGFLRQSTVTSRDVECRFVSARGKA